MYKSKYKKHDKNNFSTKLYNAKPSVLIVLSLFNFVLKISTILVVIYFLYFYFSNSIPYKKNHLGVLFLTLCVPIFIFSLNLFINNYLINYMCLDTLDKIADLQLENLSKKIMLIPLFGSFLITFIIKDKAILIYKYKQYINKHKKKSL
ncbi:hypothetical protein SGLAD_v1c08280 [Spiroplasma gladiatoris]|uniref:Uncharacterized protein n=1 Tax=Spiroplasma gladiatoris TaxID=2143 RepID=A0A4P7AIC4_9MOLU|nr:hypothetical protein [Spiroplasma gladiatoris]QBQ08027.1 hypothetical protein SGLAD_v1c08280 [Spiroplasma gladiatoris]